MNFSKTIVFLFILSFSVKGIYAQDTIKVMYYNLLNYPFSNSGKINDLQVIVQHVKPDLFVVNELTSSSGANAILSNALNTNGITYYQKATYVDGPDTDNMLYYNSNKLGLISQNVIPTVLRDVNEYILYYKDPSLSATSDTVYLYVYSAHLKAGSTAANEQQRATETATLKNYLVARPYSENTIFGGDMNIYGSYEQAYVNITSPVNANLVDPVGAGTYHNNISYSYIHTQSTRTTIFDGGAIGGMDDRFDMIFFSQDVANGTNGAMYINNSQIAIGQDGLRYNQSLVSPVNNSEPANVITALHNMSDHLPVYMELKVDSELGIAKDPNIKFHHFQTDQSIELAFNSSFSGKITLYDISGSLIKSEDYQNSSNVSYALPGSLSQGVYILTMETAEGVSYLKFAK